MLYIPVGVSIIIEILIIDIFNEGTYAPMYK
jgi:hypothetical protein